MTSWACRSVIAMMSALCAVVPMLSSRAATKEAADASTLAAYGAATGGNQVYKYVSDTGTIEFIHIFTTAGAVQDFTVPANNRIDSSSWRLMLIGGGGSGYGNCGGGGGAGGVITNSTALAAGRYQVEVGAGGVCTAHTGANTSNSGEDTFLRKVASGETTILYRAFGGGYGVGYDFGSSNNFGGSGGGGFYSTPGGSSTQANGLGNKGGDGTTASVYGGGGGGATSPGGAATSTNGGKGGDGYTTDITGEEKTYAGGGGGGVTFDGSGTAGVGGSGGGGNGGKLVAENGGDGEANTGSGGGGAAGGGGSTGLGGAGGSGIVVIRYAIENGLVVTSGTETGKATNATTGEEETWYRYTADGSFTAVGAVLAQVVAVGGGGAGANPGNNSALRGGAGGGGAGGFIETNAFYFTTGDYTIGVGAGGQPAATYSGAAGRQPGGNGEPSFIYDATAATTNLYVYGGGGGGIATSATDYAGGAGGSGGGGSYWSKSTSPAGGESLEGQGNAGGAGTLAGAGAGGGGAGAAAGSPKSGTGGEGGIGRASMITGTEVFYAGGGGGGTYANNREYAGGSGGKGGGGSGGGCTYTDDDGFEPYSATSGTDGLGGGGGGGRYNSRGGAGGSGVVIVRVLRARKGFYMPGEQDPTYTELNMRTLPDAIMYTGSEISVFDLGLDLDTDFLDVTGDVSATEAGTYTFYVTLRPGLRWLDDNSSSVVTCTWSIVTATLTTSVYIADWQVGFEPSSPVMNANIALEEGVNYVWQYREAGALVWTDWSTDDARNFAVGTYELQANILPATSYTYGDANPVATFKVYEFDDTIEYPDYLGYHIVATVTNHIGAALAGFPMLVRVNTADIANFYRLTQADGSDIRFTIPGESDSCLPFEIENWGEEKLRIWVKVPEYANGKKVIMSFGYVFDETNKRALVPDNPDASEVWSAYTGVWHMSEEIGTAAAGSAISSNSTDVVQFNASPNGTGTGAMVSGEGIIGNGRVINDISASGAVNSLRVSNTSVLNGLGTNFTFSAFVKADAFASGAVAHIASRKLQPGYNTGWEFEVTSDDRSLLAVRGAGADATATARVSAAAQGLESGEWTFVTVVYNGTVATVYGASEAGIVTDNPQLTITAVENNTVALAIGAAASAKEPFYGMMDEIRLRQGSVDADWFTADYLQAADAAVEVGHLMTLRGRVFENRWYETPSIGATVWVVGATPPEVYPGSGAYGQVVYSFQDKDGVVLAGAPTEEGSYTLTFTVSSRSDGVDGARIWSHLEYTIYITVATSSPVRRLEGDMGSATLSGRILLANDDDNDLAPVTDQSYWRTNTTEAVYEGAYWIHSAVGDSALSTAKFTYLNTEEEHWLMSSAEVPELCSSTQIWHLVDTRIGNTHSTSALVDGSRIFLPHSATSRAITSKYETERGTGIAATAAANLVMRNKVDAQVVSPCYTHGIGTVYFDAANGWVSDQDGDDYAIAFEVATNSTDEAEAEWFALDMNVLKKDGSSAFDAAFVTNSLSLNITTRGGNDSFYRVYVDVYNQLGERREPVRFRIRRTTTPPTNEETLGLYYTLDNGGFILLDNIIASFPAMSVKIKPQGLYDPSREGRQVVGWAGAFEPTFPSINDEAIYPKGRVEFLTNPGVPADELDITKFITSAKFNYRWRYLGQSVSDWKSTVMSQESSNPTNLVSSSGPIAVEREVAGDVEFWYDAVLNTPYYEYVDYSGIGLGVEGYNEAIASVQYVAGSSVFAPTLGTNWFVRLREGKSDYEDIRLITSNDWLMVNKEATANMFLASDNLWRYYNTSTTNTLSFRFEAVSLAQNSDGEYYRVTNHWAATTGEDFPPSATVTDVTEPTWAEVPGDISTGHFLFQIEDKLDAGVQARHLAVLHADYQNFNMWDDATASYVGAYSSTSEPERGGSGVSPEKQQYRQTFETWSAMSAESDLWKMPSFIDTEHMLGHELDVEFTTDRDPNNYAWLVKNAMWIPSHFDAVTNVAAQLKGNGLGYIQYQNPTNAPRGIGSISFNARVGQALASDNVTWYYDAAPRALTNYAFSALVAFDENGYKNFTGRASLSLIANYQDRRGFYEARLDQATSDIKRQRLRLFRWNCSRGGEWTTEELYTRQAGGYASPVDAVMPESGTDAHNAMYIVVSNATDGVYVYAGVTRSGIIPRTFNDNFSYDCWNVAARDTSSSKLTYGTYGMVSCNCEAKFLKPTFFRTVTSLADMPSNIASGSGEGEYGNKRIRFSDGDTRKEAILYDEWSYQYGRMETFLDESDVDYWGVQACIPTQHLYICTSRAGFDDWVTNAVVEVSGFGKAGESGNIEIPLYEIKDPDLQIRVGGRPKDVRTDVVIDSLVMNQWRGDDYENCSSSIREVLDGKANTSDWYTNITFTGAWIVDTTLASGATDKAIRLSARRAPTGSNNFSAFRSSSAPLASIRSPLMDGAAVTSDGLVRRGIGLGMVSFNFANAQPNAHLVVQIATNGMSQAYAKEMAKQYEGWEDVAEFKFTDSDLTDAEIAAGRSGVRSCYLGLHDVTGMVRVVVSTNAIAAVQGVTDESAFGEIDITDITFRDEPVIDETAWTGWNIRTYGDSTDSSGKMFLPDPGNVPVGKALALNDGASQIYEIDEDEADVYKASMPYLQTPTFSTNIVGELSFRARKYVYTSREARARGTTASSLNAKPALVALYGQRRGSHTWVPVSTFEITNTIYTTYYYKVPSGDDRYVAFRLGVLDAADVTRNPDEYPEDYAALYTSPAVRVLLEEIAVQERVDARVGFRQVGVFRTNLDTTEWTTNTSHSVGGKFQQPLCEEAWGVECEIYKAHLPDEIDLDGVEVWLHWYEGTNIWGRVNWLSQETGHAQLAEATDSNLVFRSSYLLAADAVLPQTTVPGTIVQYALEARWKEAGTGNVVTNWLQEGEWQRPDWYNPLDFNAGRSFAAYNILDSVAPGWAWINEININGDIGSSTGWANKEVNDQYIEVAVPANADLSGWRLYAVSSLGTDDCKKDLLGYFGANLPAKKDANIESGMTYRVLGGWATDTNELSVADGTLDGTWSRSLQETPFVSSDSSLNFFEPFGIQLVRPTGIVEHEVVFVGTNFWDNTPGITETDFSIATNLVKFLNRQLSAKFFYGGPDCGGATYSVNATLAQGLEGDWTNKWVHTPGHINYGQVIDPNEIPTPFGTQIPIYANIADDCRDLLEQFTSTTLPTNANQVYYAKRGGDGIEITYRAARWHELGPVTTNGVVATGWTTNGSWIYTFNVGVNASNAINIVAAVQPDKKLDAYIPEDDVYRPAVVDWLRKGSTLYGAFANPDSEDLYLADFITGMGGVLTNLSLTTMYWLDMDPTIPWTGVDETKSALALYCALKGGPGPMYEESDNRILANQYNDTLLTNTVFSIIAMITNRLDNTAWAPYALRGYNPGVTSWDYYPLGAHRNWTGETFKISGFLLGSPANASNRNNWIDLRGFVFKEGSFDRDFSTVIEVYDAHSPLSPGYEQGWKDYPTLNAVWKYLLDSHTSQFAPSILLPTNFYPRQND